MVAKVTNRIVSRTPAVTNVVRPVAVSKEYSLNFRIKSLRPNTIHYFYFNREKITDYVKQVGKKIGEDLISDANGTLDLVFYINVGSSTAASSSAYYKVTNLPQGPKYAVITTANFSVLPENWRAVSASHATLTFR